MCDKIGAASQQQIEEAFPTEERLAKGPAAVIECFERIPCNPCFAACKRKAIKEFNDINDLPIIDHDVCNGCGMCIAKCPGLAIMVVDTQYSDDEALIKIPYEFVPLPEKGQLAEGLDREGKYVCDVIVRDILTSKVLDKTPIISFSVLRKYIKNVRNISIET